MGLEYEKKRLLLAVREIEQQASRKGISLKIYTKSLSVRGNSFTANGVISQKEEGNTRKVWVKITNSSNKFLDLEREKFMYDFIKGLGYPSPSVILSGQTLDGNKFLVREYIRGVQLRDASSKILEQSLPTLLSFFTDLHSRRLDGFGLLQMAGGVWRGESDNWIEALERKTKYSFFRIKQAKIPLDNKLLNRLLGILNKYAEILINTNASLLHGDAGLINFLGDEKGLTGIIDPEFALVGDPAYEFSDKIGDDKDYPTDFFNRYLDQMERKGIDVRRESFLKRGIIYSPFIVTDIIPNLWEAKNYDGVKYFVSILPREIEKAELV